MGTARRLYLYVVSAVSLIALAAGINRLVASVLVSIEDAVSSTTMNPGGMAREQLSLAIALIVVGAPVFAVHRWLVGRGLRAEGSAGEEDRASALRAGYIATIQSAALMAWLIGGAGFLSSVLERLVIPSSYASWSEPLGVALTAFPIWALFGRAREGEIRSQRMRGAAAWLTRLYRYGGGYGSLFMLLSGVTGLVSAVLNQLVAEPVMDGDQSFLAYAVAGSLGGIVLGGASWLLHRRLAAAAVRDAAVIGEDDRQTRVRGLHDGLVLLTTATMTSLGVAAAVASLGRLVLGAEDVGMIRPLNDIAGPVLTMVPVALAGWWLAREAERTALPFGAEAAGAVRRVQRLVLAALGLTALAAGVAQLIGLAIEQVSGGYDMYSTSPANRLASDLAFVVVGAALWVPSWLAQVAARREDADREAHAAVARGYLYLAAGASLVVGVPTLVMALFQVINGVLGGLFDSGSIRSLATPLGSAVVAAAVGLYHGRLLVADMRRLPRKGEVASGDPAVAATPAAETPAAEMAEAGSKGTQARTLILLVPDGVNADQVVQAMRAHLPQGATLEEDAAG